MPRPAAPRPPAPRFAALLTVARAAALLVVAGFALFVARDFVRRHPEDVPWTPLDLTAPIGWATATKLAELRDRPAECRALLAAAGVAFTPVSPRRDGPGCSLADAGRIAGLAVPLSPPGEVMACPLAAALAVYARRVVVPAAAAAGDQATALVSLGTYNCRTIAGSDRLSQHATANAIDLAGVKLRLDTVSIARDWRDRGKRGRIAHRLHDGACRLFGVVLSPDYNAAHHDHLHLDTAPWRVCR